MKMKIMVLILNQLLKTVVHVLSPHGTDLFLFRHVSTCYPGMEVTNAVCLF